MSLQQSKILLDKIVALHKSVEIDGQISSIERDLMLSYVRQFYEAFLSPSTEEQPKAAKITEAAPVIEYVIEKPVPKEVPVAVAPTPAPVVEPTPVVIPEPIKEPVVEKVIEPTPAPKPIEVVAPVVEKKEEYIAPSMPIPPNVFPEPPKPKAAQKPLIKPANERVEQSELFEEKMRKELSDKLGEMPIDDIKKGMSLNEKIIFLNDLFDGNYQEFESAVNNLNNAGNFEKAKNILAELASRLDWASKEKQAKPFIRLVRRRYNG